MTGHWPEQEPDHANHIRHDNRWVNICDEATFLEQHGNQIIRRDNTSGLKGVSWDTSRGRWASSLHLHEKRIYLGRFYDPILAGLTYDAAAKLAWGIRFSCLNFPPEESDHIVLSSRIRSLIGGI